MNRKKVKRDRKTSLAVGLQLEDTPNKNFLKTDATPDQVEERNRLREFQLLVAKCWKARFSGSADPLKGLSISEQAKDKIWNRVNLLQAFWALVQEGYEVISITAKEENFPFPFENPAQLFTEAVHNDVDAVFRVCLRPYHEVSVKKAGKAASSSAESLRRHRGASTPMTTKEETQARGQGYHKEFRTYIKELEAEGKHDWWLLTLNFCGIACRKQPKKHRRLQQRLDDHSLALERSNHQIATASRRRGEWENLIHPSFAWDNGKRVYASSNGAYMLSKT